MKISTRLALIFSICVFLIGCDQLTKHLASEYLPRGEMYSFLQDTVRIGYTENLGAFLGMGSDLAPELRFWVFVVGVGVALAGLAAYLVMSKSLSPTALVGFSLLLSGGLSNFYDRVVNNGAVVDFLNLGFGSVRTGVFNVADMAIMLGLVIMIFHRPVDDVADVSSETGSGER